MPMYCFRCACGNEFEDLRKFGDYAAAECPKCGKQAEWAMADRVHCSFTDPRGTSKWENFEYRAGWNMEKAKGERRAAEAATKYSPYRERVNDFDTKGVFDSGGVDNESAPGLVIPS